MLSEIFEAVRQLFRTIYTMLGFISTAPPIAGHNGLRIFVKHGLTQTAVVDLDPTWSIRKVKEIAAPQLGLQPEEIKLIFAGKELPDELIIQSCDVGQQSFLHAVRVQVKNKSLMEDPSSRISESREMESATDDDDQSSSVVASAQPQNEETELQSSDRMRTASMSDSEIFPPHIHSANTQSDFFVFCTTCQSLEEGKLRVRCAVCQSGAFEVLRDPEGWDDVLKPNQVPGSCETPDCPSNFAQFYFKCSVHVTSGEDDSSPPLPQVKRNPENVPCLACGDSKDPIFVFPCPDTHVTCIECFQQFALLKINQRQFVQDPDIGYTLGCPALCENSLIRDPHNFKLLGVYQYDRYQRFGAEECVLQAGGVLCPQPNCGMGIIPADVGCNKIACVHGCGYVFCRICLEGWHIGECTRSTTLPSSASPATNSGAYPLTQERVALAQWDDETRRAMRISFKPCPKCRVVTERAGGCMHMECARCSFQWCWVCQNKWTRECMGNHWFG